ncbi:transmembrane protein 138-like [Panulirus ornatus]|uniref:transmembrane protein 138-like n=1 Tax=Panulirus ornatus TaxID=150431 RepID=UPI003A883BCA
MGFCYDPVLGFPRNDLVLLQRTILAVLLLISQVFSSKYVGLLVYIIQDVCLVFSLILLFLALFSTTLSQAGLIGELFHKFQWCIFIAVTYLGLSVGLHSWSLKQQWQKPDIYIWTYGLVSLFTIQRVVGGLHYYLYKRTILHLSDKNFYTQLPVESFK